MAQGSRIVRPGFRDRYFGGGDLSCGSALVPGGVSADHLRIRLSSQVREEENMKIVVVKSPKYFRGILRKLFGIKE